MTGSASFPDDLDPLERSLLGAISETVPSSGWPATGLDPVAAAQLFEAQVTSRLVDHTARWMRGNDRGYYTIASAGHEANAAVAMALRPTDPALLHYRSGGFYVARAGQVAGSDPVGDILRGMLAATTEPIAGGRHKVFGNRDLHIIPQTSTIGSHGPRAVGLADSLARAARLGTEATWPLDSVVVCSFGDASLNHSTTQGALNFAAHSYWSGSRVPVLFVLEDNGLGISVPSPDGWVAASVSQRPGLNYLTIDGSDPAAVYDATTHLAASIRADGRPAVLHLRTVRFLGHAGSDVESGYRSAAEIRADHDRDPIAGTARLLLSDGSHHTDDLVAWYLDMREDIRRRADELAGEPEFVSAAQVMEPLAGPSDDTVRKESERLSGEAHDKPMTMALTINRALGDVLEHHSNALVFGEDVARKGGVYGVTRGLQRRFGPDRVFDTLLDETSIFGLALGSALNGFLPIPEIQYLAYLHNAADQLRGEGATLGFFSGRQYVNPMVVRIAAYGYQRGFGGHFHNDNSVAALRDIPGLLIASPGHPSDAAAMLKTCVGAAMADGAVAAFLEPIARYHTTDLHDEHDGGWLAPYAADAEHVPVGAARTHGNGSDLTIITWANGLYLSLRAQQKLAADHGLEARVVDLRWLAPLPVDDILREASATGNVLVADETRRTGGVGEGVIAALSEGGFTGRVSRVASKDSFIPLGPAAELILMSEDEIVAAAVQATA